jgi:hypothetical protein
LQLQAAADVLPAAAGSAQAPGAADRLLRRRSQRQHSRRQCEHRRHGDRERQFQRFGRGQFGRQLGREGASGAGSLSGSAAGVTNYYGGGSHGGYYSGPMASGYIQGLNVEGGEARRRQSYEATRTKVRRIILRAVCLDDRDVPHPASQVTPDRDIDDAYDGELYRCIAGSRMQYVIADYSGQIDISTGGGGQTYICQKNEALYHSPGAASSGGQGGQGTMSCRPQRPARDCNERSLLRRFGAGVKILTILTTETYTAYREETVQERQSITTSFSLDGGVGGVVY